VTLTANITKTILISVDLSELRVAVLEEGQTVEALIERRGKGSLVGNIYKGKVDNVLPGMEAAFVDIGLPKNCFLHQDDVMLPGLDSKDRRKRRIQEMLKPGQEVLVQVIKDPMGTKGARVTMELSLAGRFLVLSPQGEGSGVSRRLPDGERDHLRDLARKLEAKDVGIIVRTAAAGATEEDLERDLRFLRRLWAQVEARVPNAKAPSLVHAEADLSLRVIRDLLARNVDRVIVDSERQFRRILGWVRTTQPEFVDRIESYNDATPLFEKFGVDAAIRSTLNRRVDLPSGGYLLFDFAEAFTVIDVNTGRFVGGGGRLEDTITRNNIEAAREVVRQLRLRDIGGIIVVDFIDMAAQKNRTEVLKVMQSELEKDRTKTYVVEISPLGLVEMTRQNVTEGVREVLTRTCPTCGGDGIIISEHTAAVDVERGLRALVTPGSRAKAFRVEVAARVAWLVAGPGGTRLRELEETTKRRFFLVGKEDEHLDHFRVLDQGTLEKVAPKLPVDVGQEVDVKLGEVGLHDPQAGVGKIEDVDVVVAGAAKLVGKKVKVRINGVTDGLAWAELLSPMEAAEEPLTAEAEAEKPTRARRPSAARKEAEAVVEAEAEDEDEDEDEADEAVAETDEGEEAAAVKKKTRRGSRGGRNRKKKPAVAAENGAEAPTEEVSDTEAVSGSVSEPEPDAEDGPVIHVPDRELGAEDEDGEAPSPQKKRTRRGSRGGRNRRKKTTTATVSSENGSEPALEAEPEPEPETEPEEDAGEWTYTPMSEWGLDER